MRCLDFSVLRFGTLQGPSSDTVKRQLPGGVQRRRTLKRFAQILHRDDHVPASATSGLLCAGFLKRRSRPSEGGRLSTRSVRLRR
jgi:hypothetical protein